MWIKFPKLPLNCWGNNLLSRIASSIGTPVYADECIAKQIIVSYTRMLIEVDVTKSLFDKINVKDPNGRVFRQTIIYDWKPIFCKKCQVIRHKCQQEGRRQEQQHKDQMKEKKGSQKLVQQWVTKDKGKAKQHEEEDHLTKPNQSNHQ